MQLTLRRRHIFQLGVVSPWTCTVPVRWYSRSSPIVESPHASICRRLMDRWLCTFVLSYDLFCVDERDTTSTYCTNQMLKNERKKYKQPKPKAFPIVHRFNDGSVRNDGINNFTFECWLIRDGRGSFGFMAFLLTLIAGRIECGVLNDIITIAAQRAGCRAFHARWPRWRRWHRRWPIIDRKTAAVSTIGH